MTKQLPMPISICFIMPKAYPLFNRACPAYFGGAEVDLYMLAKELALDERFQISFIVADYGQPYIEERDGLFLINGCDLKSGPWKNARRLWQALKTADSQIYFLKTPSPALYLAYRFCQKYHRRLVYRTANSNETDGTYAHKHPLLGRLFYRVLKKAAWVFTQNDSDAQNLRQNLALVAHAIKNGHQIMPAPAPQPRDNILWVGRSVTIKNPHLFFQLARKFPQEHFTMICRRATGDEQYEQLAQLARQTPNLEFLPDVPFEKTSDYFCRAKLFVNTSAAEGFPNTYIQACMAATPILSFTVNPDNFLHHFNCGRCADNEWPKFCRCFEELQQPELLEQLGRNAYHYVRGHHDIKQTVNQYKQLFVTQP